MSFRLFGVNVRVQAWFWVTSAILGYSGAERDSMAFVRLAVWVAVVFVSVLVHEYGHALAMMRYGIVPSITLHALGGLTHATSAPTRSMRRRDGAFISLAGPGAGFVLGGLVLAIPFFAPATVASLPPVGLDALRALVWVNIGWGLINLAPVHPFDGGNVLAMILGPERTKTAAMVSMIVGGLITLAFFWHGDTWGAMIFGFAAIQSYRVFAARPGAEGGSDEDQGPSSGVVKRKS